MEKPVLIMISFHFPFFLRFRPNPVLVFHPFSTFKTPFQILKRKKLFVTWTTNYNTNTTSDVWLHVVLGIGPALDCDALSSVFFMSRHSSRYSLSFADLQKKILLWLSLMQFLLFFRSFITLALMFQLTFEFWGLLMPNKRPKIRDFF